MRKYLKIFFNVLVYIFAIIGFAFLSMFFAIKWGFTNTEGVIDNQRENFIENTSKINTSSTTPQIYIWSKSEDWRVIKEAVLKDRAVLERAGIVSGVKPRLIFANLAVEQLRLFNSDRESFKKFFEPLKILGSQTKFSWGVMGMKEETAKEVEQNLKDKNSIYYLGESFENLLDFKTNNIEKERFIKMTDQHNHFGSYLYAGLFLKQIQTQWRKSGFPIDDRADILATIYNIGFKNSKPNENPRSGGAEIEIGGVKYSFGKLAEEIYNSNELIEEMPR
jgi:hypothetical protein